MGKSKEVEKDFAKTLFVNDKLSQKEVAARVGVTEKTIGTWIKAGKWEEQRISLTTTKDNQLAVLYQMLGRVTEYLADGIPNSKDADVIAKLTTSIQRLETETNVGNIIATAKEFIQFVNQADTDFSKRVTDFFDAFINSKLK